MNLPADIAKALNLGGFAPPVSQASAPHYELARFLERWSDVAAWTDLVREFYPAAATMEIYTESEYTDEYYTDTVSQVIVYDAVDTDITNDLDELRYDQFREQWWEHGTPQKDICGVRIALAKPKLSYSSKSWLLEQLALVQQAIHNLPDECFATSKLP